MSDDVTKVEAAACTVLETKWLVTLVSCLVYLGSWRAKWK